MPDLSTPDVVTIPGRPAAKPHYPVIVIGGGQAGLSVSAYLNQAGIEHLVLEKHRIAHNWRAQRWDSFCLVTPNWQCQLPGFPYPGDEPEGFMVKDDIVRYIEAFAERTKPPIREGVGVTQLTRQENGSFLLQTSAGAMTASNVVVAVSGYHVPSVPRVAERLPAEILQLHSSQYRNPQQLPAGGVLVVGTGQSGCQIAEDLHLAGRRVHLSLGSAPRSPRRYRGKDAIDWLNIMGQYALTVDNHPKGAAVRRQANHYMTGRDGGRDIDLRRFARDGMALYGRLDDIRDTTLSFAPDLTRKLDAADEVYLGIRAMIDHYIAEQGIAAPEDPPYGPVWAPQAEPTGLDLAAAGIASVVWSTGFRSDWSWIDVPVFSGSGYPAHHRGITPVPGLCFVGLPWLHSWGSGRFSGIAEDARHIVDAIVERTIPTQIADYRGPGRPGGRRSAGSAGGERPPLVVLPSRPVVPRWSTPVTIGMPQLCSAGLSETWLLKEAGHRHWMMLAEAIGRVAAEFEDEAGNRIYAAFTGMALEDANLRAAQEGDSLGFAGSIRRISHTQFMSEQQISLDGRPIATLRLISVFLRRRSPGQNGSIERAALKHLPPFRGPSEAAGFAGTAYAFRSGQWDSFGAFRRHDRRLLRSFAVDPNPQADFNGADLLYFASFQTFVDRAEWAWFRYADPVAATRQRHIFYSGNIDLGDTLDIRLCAVTRGPRHCAHWCEIVRQSDGSRIAEIITERVLGD